MSKTGTGESGPGRFSLASDSDSHATSQASTDLQCSQILDAAQKFLEARQWLRQDIIRRFRVHPGELGKPIGS